MQLLICLFTSLFTLFFWEHFARINNFNIKPTYFIDFLTKTFRKIWYKLGQLCGFVGKCYEYLHLDEIFITLNSFVKSIRDLLFSISYFRKGFDYFIEKCRVPALARYFSIITLFLTVITIIAILSYTYDITEFINGYTFYIKEFINEYTKSLNFKDEYIKSPNLKRGPFGPIP